MNKSCQRVVRMSAMAVFLGGVVGASQGAFGSTVVSERFDYANGSLTGQNGGTGWGGAWTGTQAIVNGGAATATSSVGSINFRSLASAINTTSGRLNISFDLGSETSGAGDFAGFSFLTGSTEKLFLGMAFNQDAYSATVVGVTTFSTGIAVTPTRRQLVTEIIFNSATNLTLNLYVDPVGALGTPNATSTGTFSAGSWDTIRLVTAGNPAIHSSVDNFVVATSAADLVPVPLPAGATMGLAGLMGLGLRRRR